MIPVAYDYSALTLSLVEIECEERPPLNQR